MILIPSFTKKHAAALFLGTAALVTTVLTFQSKNNAAPRANDETASAVTVERYEAQVQASVADFVAGDANAAADTLDKLLALKVPAESMRLHFALVSTLTAYHQALVQNDRVAAAQALGRLKALTIENGWIGIVIND